MSSAENFTQSAKIYITIFEATHWLTRLSNGLTGVSIHDRGFGFVQFEREDDAKKAAGSENGSLLKGNRLGK